MRLRRAVRAVLNLIVMLLFIRFDAGQVWPSLEGTYTFRTDLLSGILLCVLSRLLSYLCIY